MRKEPFLYDTHGQWLPYRRNTLPLSANPLQSSRLYIPLRQKKQYQLKERQYGNRINRKKDL
ncbi:hypothetical protein BFAG_01174 [Bacteroides fragilis 3_1_12]|uniref:Uncharacterized protein n=1 Tax=Bacteroides fragilis 3_1_12 TaxID=457424 RepID=A0ABN0BHT9_BACFG|nr:hypothetical protein BFAG_01174 [Bacteroides fragilis 3_1_12]